MTDLWLYFQPQSDGELVSMQMPSHFRLEQLQEEFDFATDEEIEINRRYKLLQYREKEIPDFVNYKMIPANEKEVPQNVFEVSLWIGTHFIVTFNPFILESFSKIVWLLYIL